MVLILFCLFVVLSTPVQSDVYYIVESITSDCVTNNNCNTLEYYLNHSMNYSNSIFYFRKGTYNVDNAKFVHESNLTLSAEEPDSYVLIQCQSILFMNCNNIKLSYLHVICTSSVNTSALIFNETNGLVMDHVWLQTEGRGLDLENTLDVTITNSFFNKSNGVIVLFTDFGAMNQTSLHLENTKISTVGNNASYGIVVNLSQSDYIVNITFKSLLVTTDSGINIGIINNGSFQYNLLFDNVTSTSAAGCIIIFQTAYGCGINDSYHHKPQIVITGSVISSCSQFGMSIEWLSNAPASIKISSTLFKDNKGERGTNSLSVIHYKQAIADGDDFKVDLLNVTFDDNKSNTKKYDINPSFQSVAAFIAVTDINIANCTFSNNEGSGLFLFDSIATFRGQSIFVNNSGYDGGGITMFAGSLLLLERDAFLNFTANMASSKGGALYIAQVVLDISQRDIYNESVLGYCFYRLLNKENSNKTYFYFESNTADEAGSVIYGGVTSSCPLTCQSSANDDLFSTISTYVNQSGISIISSDSRNVCFCDDHTNVPDCSKDSLEFWAFPGETISFSVAVVGQYHNTTNGVVSVYEGSSSNEQGLEAKCTTLNHTVRNNDGTSNVTLRVTLSEGQSNFIPTPKTILIYIDPCLTGFYLSNVTGMCECPSVLKENTTTIIFDCQPNKDIIIKKGRLWYSYDNSTGCVIAEECPYNYCTDDKVEFALNHSDLQCALNRSGTLCGRCAKGLSLMLGTNQCGECTNGYIALIIPFALAGIILVALLAILNLTVSVGTVNGLIFYANVIKLYESAFFPGKPIPLLSQFISWINLDLGIQTCFIDGMNSIIKTGLQFVFPFYIWFIICLIILWSRRSSRLSKAIGNNAVPVLATLLLLSYTKLLRTVILILSIATITCEDNADGVIHVRNIWYIDPNATYIEDPRHLVLFIISLLVLVALIVPYTLFLLLFPVFELLRSKWSICTSLYLKLKPLFDAYAGPYNDHFRFWPGLLIAARVALALVVSSTSSFIPQLSVLVAVLVVLILSQTFIKVYRNPIYNNLDICFYFCLLVMVYVVQYIVTEVSVNVVVDPQIGLVVMLTISLILSLAIVLYHTYLVSFLQLKKKCKSFKLKKLQTELTLPNEIEEQEQDVVINTDRITTTIVSLREPLLESET